jgi:hypothetical protein
MRTSDDLWGWIWEDDEVLDRGALADLANGDDAIEALPPSLPPQAIRTEDLWEWLAEDEPIVEADPLSEAEALSAATGDRAGDYSQPAVFLDAEGSVKVDDEVETQPEVETEAQPEVEAEAQPEAVVDLQEAEGEPEEIELADEMEPPPAEGNRGARISPRAMRFAALVLLAAVVGTVAPRVMPAVLDGPGPPEAPAAVVPEQTVVSWSMADDESGLTFSAVVARGVLPPVILAIPADVTLSLPGQGQGTMRDAAWTGDPGFVEVATENLLGVPVDFSVVMDPIQLSTAIDAAGGIVVGDQPMNGEAAVAYLTDPSAAEVADERFLRWQDVLEGLAQAVAARPESAAAFPEGLRPVLAASGNRAPDLLAFPVIDIGAGVLRPDDQAVEELIGDRFVIPGGDVVRLVVLNGVGEPGVGEEVARILIPSGFRLMSSDNANRFDYEVTRIVATSEEDLPSARRAQELLGTGQILLGAQPQLADVIVVVGRDFAGGA